MTQGLLHELGSWDHKETQVKTGKQSKYWKQPEYGPTGVVNNRGIFIQWNITQQ